MKNSQHLAAKSERPIVPLGDVVEFNPRFSKDELADDSLASFIPMKCVEEESGRFESLGDRKVVEVRKGYTPFRDGDVIFAKVTPCMENGKAAVLKGLTNGVGFGSTEFFALRPKIGLDANYLFHFILQSNFRRDAARNMTGAVGLRRVPKSWLEQQSIPLPPLDEQRHIVAEIEKQFTRLEAGLVALRRVQANLKRYRAAVLKAACEGKLVSTEVELAKNGNRKAKFESGEALLARILTERRQNWRGRGKYKELAAPETAGLPTLPQGWVWANVEQLGDVQLGRQRSPQNVSKNYPTKYIRAANITESGIDVTDVLEMEFSPAERERFALRDGDIVLSEASGSPSQVGKPAVWRNELPLCCFQNTVLRLRPEVVGSKYVLVAFQHFYANSVFAKVAGGVGINHLGAEKFSAIPFPLPPLTEQKRIVAEVERRLSVVEELDGVVSANLQRATRLRQSILQKAFAGEHVAPMPAVQISDIIPPLKPEHVHQPNSHFARALLSAEIVHRLHIEPTFGRIKHQKIFHLCEHIAQIEEIHGQYHREAAGPLDNKLIYANEAELKKQKWYQEVRRESYGHAYQALDKAGGHRKYVERYWADKLPIIEKLIELMRKWDTERCEIFCTAYAAWNDLILWSKPATEDNILHEILERWHDSKKRFPKERWLKAIGWMNKEGFVPTGFGKPTKEAK